MAYVKLLIIHPNVLFNKSSKRQNTLPSDFITVAASIVFGVLSAWLYLLNRIHPSFTFGNTFTTSMAHANPISPPIMLLNTSSNSQSPVPVKYCSISIHALNINGIIQPIRGTRRNARNPSGTKRTMLYTT